MDFTALLIYYVIMGVVFGFICRYVAKSKGYEGGFAWGFFLGIIGLLVVGFRPTIQNQPASPSSPSDTPDSRS